MKAKIFKTLSVAFLSVLFTQAAFAQCDKTSTLTSSETNYLDNEGNITRTIEQDVVIIITPTDITIQPGDDAKMAGKISSKTCDWKVPYKEGKMVIKSTIANDQGEKHVTVTIEGKAGKITLTFEAEEMKDRKIQVVADKFI